MNDESICRSLECRYLLQLLFVVEIQNCRDACLMGDGKMEIV